MGYTGVKNLVEQIEQLCRKYGGDLFVDDLSGEGAVLVDCEIEGILSFEKLWDLIKDLLKDETIKILDKLIDKVHGSLTIDAKLEGGTRAEIIYIPSGEVKIFLTENRNCRNKGDNHSYKPCFQSL